MKAIYKNHERLFELIQNNKNADKVIDKISKRENKKNHHDISIYLSREYQTNIISIIISFDTKEDDPDLQFILSQNSKDLKVRGSSFSNLTYEGLTVFLEKYKKETMRILMDVNIEMAF